jgi:hypothetical protein
MRRLRRRIRAVEVASGMLAMLYRLSRGRKNRHLAQTILLLNCSSPNEQTAANGNANR